MMIYNYICNVDDFPNDILDNSFTFLPSFIKDDIYKSRNVNDKKCRLIARLILYDILRNDGVVDLIRYWERNIYGKPSIPGWRSFNITHSNKLLIVSLSTETIGVDVEELRKIDLSNLTAWLHPEELNHIFKSQDPLSAFYHVWIRKEAFFKALGTGLSNEMNRLNCTLPHVFYKGLNWYFHEVKMDGSYLACICSRQQDVQFQNTIVKPGTLQF